jgi:membrane-associated protein
MSYARFTAYNMIGSVAWTTLFLGAGYKFADLPVVRHHFHYVILAIIVISCIPPVVEFLRSRRKAAQ